LTDCSSECKTKSMFDHVDQSGAKNARDLAPDLTVTVTNMTFFRQRDPLLPAKSSGQDQVKHRGVTPPTTKTSGSTDCSSECKTKSMFDHVDQSGAKNARDSAPLKRLQGHAICTVANMTFFRQRDPQSQLSGRDGTWGGIAGSRFSKPLTPTTAPGWTPERNWKRLGQK
jgi:hypothetical protein